MGQNADPESPVDPDVQHMIRQLQEKYRAGTQYLPGYGIQETESQPGLPRVFAPTRPRTSYTKYQWKRDIVATIFWIGEDPTENNPTPNNKSSWDQKWEQNYGGYDDPDRSNRTYFRPKSFVPGLNPFYVALPFNDIQGGKAHRDGAEDYIPWYDEVFVAKNKTVLKGRWIAVRYGTKICYAQWEDVGPFETDDQEYVFGDKRPRTVQNNGAGLDVSPAVRDFLSLRSGGKCDWRFVELEEVPTGPWRDFGVNNPFVHLRKSQELEASKTVSAAAVVDQSAEEEASEGDGATVLTPPPAD